MGCENCGEGKIVIFCGKDLDYLFSKIDWAKSFLDADAVKIMNGERGVVCTEPEPEVKD